MTLKKKSVNIHCTRWKTKLLKLNVYPPLFYLFLAKIGEKAGASLTASNFKLICEKNREIFEKSKNKQKKTKNRDIKIP